MHGLATRRAVELSSSLDGQASLRGLIDQIAVWARKIDRDPVHLINVGAKQLRRKIGR
jgi:hypothetical protein